MRAWPIILLAAALTIPSIGHSQDQGLVGGKVGPNLGSSLGSAPSGQGSSSQEEEGYGSRPRVPQERPGFAGAVSQGQIINRTTPVTRDWGA